MIKTIAILSVFLLVSCFIGAGENSKIISNGTNNFPSISGIDLHGKKQQLPTAFSGEYNIIAIGFEREHQEPIDTWINYFNKNNFLSDKIKFYEVPLIYELSKFSRTWVNNGMRFGIPSNEARQRTITVYTNRQEFTKILQMKEDRIYILVLNKSGKILWRTEGYASVSNTKSIEEFFKKIK
jgi:hypothetical protein